MDTEQIVIERTYNVSVDTVWRALTDIAQINEWFFKLEDFKPEVGFSFSFSGNDGGTVVVHECVVKEVIAGKKLAYSFIYSGYPGDSLVTYELFAEGEGTKLVLTHSNLENMLNGSPMFAREKFVGGWTYLTGKLKNFLEKE
ncbi:SRPBCC domain-containing protein [Mucilaginibacter sp.]|uniref:SRPBCC family protein n=1 Tax=Mucilaginibacter sp. TaxID=1882438 RepID=UPI00260C3FEF|nr:SRPBCC domain-containing protein [Mucilaginibacter sp.]MDB5029571.1 ATPase [Mucilaginibacter sp.]